MPVEFTFACPLAAGLHARPASLLAERANAFACDCELTNLRTGAAANLKSTLAIIGADVRGGDSCRVVFHGRDEGQALSSLRRLVENQLPSADDAILPTEKTGAQLPRALRDTGVTFLPGTGVSDGIGVGAVVHIGGMALPQLESRTVMSPEIERERITLAIAAVGNRIGARLSRAKTTAESAILKAHLSILRDVSLIGQVHEFISRGQPAEHAVVHAAEYFRDGLRNSASAYVRERALDLQDVSTRLLEELGVVVRRDAVKLVRESVILAENLTPQELLAMDRKYVAGLVLEYAGATSHTVILARSLGIPALAGVPGALGEFGEGEQAVVDATRGLLVKNHSPAVQRFYQRECETLRRRKARQGRMAKSAATTADGRTLEVAANVSSPVEIRSAFESGADGIGVFRTEMLFLDRESAPTEQEQFEVYAEAARAAQGRPVIIRTLDIGGDKRVPHLHLPEEANPFLGYRGARIYPEHAALFRTQARAILRASAFGRVQIMLPMISNAAEVRWARERVAEVRNELEKAGATMAAEVPVGIMIEVPSVAYSLAEMSEVSDFFSIGTNDLSQYFFAADRGNVTVWPLANSTQPPFLRFLKHIVDGAHARKKWIGICGEMGGEPKLLPLMLGLGFDEISASVPNVAALKQGVAGLRQSDCENLLAEAIDCHSAEEVNLLLERARPVAPLPLLDRELIVMGSDSATKEEAIRELIDAVYAAGRTDNRQQLEDAIWAREQVSSTALGFGFAIPHCKNDAVLSDSIAVVKLAAPIEWGTENKVGFAILLAMRESAKDNAHMQVFSRLARKLMNEEFRARLLAAGKADAILALLSEEATVAP